MVCDALRGTANLTKRVVEFGLDYTLDTRIAVAEKIAKLARIRLSERPVKSDQDSILSGVPLNDEFREIFPRR